MLFKSNNKSDEEVEKGKYSPLISCFLLLVTIVLIIYSSDLIVESAKNIASCLNISEKGNYYDCYCNRNKLT